MQDSHPTRPSAEASNPVKAFSAWWNVVFAEFLAATKKCDATFYFVMQCYSAFMAVGYQPLGILEVYLDELNKLVRTHQVDEVNGNIFLQRRAPDGQTMADVVRNSRISLAKYPHAASFFNLAPTVQPSEGIAQNAESPGNQHHRGYFK